MVKRRIGVVNAVNAPMPVTPMVLFDHLNRSVPVSNRVDARAVDAVAQRYSLACPVMLLAALNARCTRLKFKVPRQAVLA